MDDFLFEESLGEIAAYCCLLLLKSWALSSFTIS